MLWIILMTFMNIDKKSLELQKYKWVITQLIFSGNIKVACIQYILIFSKESEGFIQRLHVLPHYTKFYIPNSMPVVMLSSVCWRLHICSRCTTPKIWVYLNPVNSSPAIELSVRSIKAVWEQMPLHMEIQSFCRLASNDHRCR
jgi:hypothetical protein